ncbi:MAG: transferase [Deltaproteobacteria bacterium RIFCSPHIGHO2_02_FULL_40_11]|nr:MAG: transferase [Deltaproteobacteria bacterium RIFCSPHIGHO2_02_FULL_40_11]
MNDYFVHASSFIEENVSIGKGTKIWYFSHVRHNANIGENCNIGQSVFIGENVRIGNYCKIQNNVSIYAGVQLEDYVFCGPSMVFTNILNPRCLYPQNSPEHYLPTFVKRGASIGANATIVCGHTIGEHAFIGAGSVVTRDVPPHALFYGNPAKLQGWVCECGIKLNFASDTTVCHKCGLKYFLDNNKINRMESL